ncbi:putative casein kinase I [Leptomonas seymouri]|uniref:non-specific serine/threonine protein kinase n=1 Tax=Leptomonas seymouri TaxID=5684 RepID=A0A0N1HU44_LEPSE|nr:putative casein kinase I [Leptomonas seymouri]|eukprot:KPI83618.1 putative casein kinase I [Leptomonas seymouri]
MAGGKSKGFNHLENCLVLNGHYRIGRRIGGGSFGEIFLGVDTQSRETVAIKVERSKTNHPQLLAESRYYNLISQGRAAAFMPIVYGFSEEGDYNVMVMELMGPSLEDLLSSCGHRLSLKTTLMLADQMLKLIEFVHCRSVLHRDIKPDNFIMGRGNKAHHVHIIDFGLAKKYRDPRTHVHIPYKEGKSLTGTARYCSVNTHLGIEQSRRDDMEGIAYLLIYFIQGTLPWQGLKADSKDQKYGLIAKVKMCTPIETLCQGIPVEFASFVNYARALRFEDQPDYGYVRAMFRRVFEREGYQEDYAYDWTVRAMQESMTTRLCKRGLKSGKK